MPNWKNRLRGARNPHRVLSEIRSEVEPRQYAEILKWLPNLAGRRLRALNPAFPADFGSLMRQEMPLSPVSLRKELLWTTTRILQEADRISAFVCLRQELEEAWLTGDQRRFEGRLAHLEESFGSSLFLIELKTVALQKWRGLEPQKSFSSSIRKQSKSQIVRFLTFHISERNEDATSPHLFRRRVEKTISTFSITSALKKYLIYRLLGLLPDSPSELAGILRYEANSSLIDQYETLVNVLCENPRYHDNCQEALTLISSAIEDARLERAKILFGTAPLSIDHASALALRAEYLLDSGLPSQALQILSDSSDSALEARLIVLRGLAMADLGNTPSEKGSIPLLRLRQLVTMLACKADDYDDRLSEILKSMYCLSLFSVFDLIRPALLELVSDEYGYSEPVLSRYFTAGGLLSPALLPIIPSDSRLAFSGALKEAGYQLVYDPDDPEEKNYAIAGVLRWRLYIDDDEMALSETEVEFSRLPIRIRRQTLRRRVRAFLALRDIRSALHCIASGFLEDPDVLLMVPITECVASIDDEAGPDETGDPLITAIVYDLYLRFYGDDRPHIRSDAFEDFLAQQRIKRPSELNLDDFGASIRPYLIYFLRYVCLPEVMLSSPHFENSRSLDSERVTICTLLIGVDPKNAAAYEQELRDITRKMVVSEGLRDVEQSKFAMDTNPIRRWADKHVKENFARFQALRAAGVAASNIEQLTTEDEDISLPESPIDEAASLLTDTVQNFVFECYTNSFYGLDSYLSLRARHGSLSGQLRAPLEEERIITQRAEGSGAYVSNREWLDRLTNSWIIEKVDNILKEFSRSFDIMIQSFADNQLQIATTETPEGLFSFRITELDLYSVALDVRADSTFSSFIDRCIEVFWANVGESLGVVRNYIESILSKEVASRTAALIQELERLRFWDESLDDLISAVRRAQSRLQYSLITLQSWFFLPKSISTKPLSIDEMVDVSLQQVRKLHPNFDPVVRREGPVSTILIGRRISDMLFIIFENVQKHSKMEHPTIDFTVSQGEDHIVFEVISDYAAVGELEVKLSQIRQMIDSGTYQHVVRSEGGTGLVKLWNIIRAEYPSHRAESALLFGDVNGRFRVEVRVPFTLIL